MRERLLSYVRRHGLMRPGDRIGVAVSGGADSVALLRLLVELRAELGIVLSVVHFNHRIRGADADADEQFAGELAQHFGFDFFSHSADTPAHAAEHKLSLEAAARELRYRFFDELTGRTVDRVATAHTRDDQAETVLLRLIRGTGPAGLAGIHPGMGAISRNTTPVAPSGLRVIRPLLEISRAELRSYLQQLGQAWREDATNQDVSFTRNRLRHEIMPLLRQLNPNLDHVLSETATIARDEEAFWGTVLHDAQEDLWAAPSGGSPRLNVQVLRKHPLALQRRLLRLFALTHGVRLEFHHVEQLRELAAESTSAKKHVELPQDFGAVRAGQELWIERRCQTTEPRDYEFALTVPGEKEIPEAGLTISAILAAAGDRLDPALAGDLRVRNWRPGDRYQPAHTSRPKKVKELLQARHIPRAVKTSWPVVISGAELVWIPGFAAPERFRVRNPDGPGLLLTYVPLRKVGEIAP